MDNGGQENTASGSQNQLDLSITHAASSMINASDKIPLEAYQANQKRIEAVKEIVRRLEVNNEIAHKNFLMGELEKRAKEGREAEEMLSRLKNTSGLPDMMHLTSQPPNDGSDVLPSTATLVEVPEYSSSAPAAAPRPRQPSQLPQPQRPVQLTSQDYSTSQRPFIHYAPPSVTQPGSAALQPSTPIITQGRGTTGTGGYATQTVPVSKMPVNHAFNTPALPTSYQLPHPRQQIQPWKVYYPPTHVPPAAAQGVSSIQPGQGAWNAGPSKSGTYPQPTFPNSFPVYQVPLSTVQNQFQNLAPRTQPSETPRDASRSQMGQASGQSTAVQLTPTGAASQPHSRRTTVQEPQIPAFEPPRQQAQFPQQSLPQQPPQSRPHQPLPPNLPTQQPPPQQSSSSSLPPQAPQPRSQQVLPPSLPAQPPSRSHSPSGTFPSTQPLQGPPEQPHPPSLPSQQPPRPLSQQPIRVSLLPQRQPPLSAAPQQSTSTAPSSASAVIPQVPSSGSSQVHSRPIDATSQIRHTAATHPVSGQGVRSQQAPHPFADQATFVNCFQTAFQRGPEIMKAFWVKSMQTGVDQAWFEAAVRTIPQAAWSALVAESQKSGTASDSASPRPSAAPQNLPATTRTSVPLANARPPPTIQPIQPPPLPAPLPASAPFVIPSGIAPGQPVVSYAMAAELNYYSDKATRAAFAGQGVNTPRAGPQSAPVPQTTPPECSVPQTQTSPKTPKEADKSTLARDILRSLGRPIPKPKEMRNESSNEVSNREPEGGLPRLREHALSTTVTSVTPTRPPTPVPTTTPLVGSPSVPPECSIIPEAPQGVTSTHSFAVSEAKPVPQEQPRPATVFEGPIMVDLTLEDSDESVDGSGQKVSSPIQSAAATSHTVSPPNTTTHTPQLEGLSLEEVPVEATSEGDNVDVRMQSPPSRLTVAEEDAELLYPANDIESPSPNSKSRNSSSKGAMEHPVRSQLPLFFPSPPASPTPSDRSPHTEPPEMDPEMYTSGDENRPYLKRRSMEVDGMEIDTDLAPLRHARKRRKQRAYVLVPTPPSAVKKLMRKSKESAVVKGTASGSEGEEDDEELRYNPLERLVIEESKSRLLERRCQWLGCDAILNCGSSLLAHLTNHTHGESLQAPFICHWAGCKRRYNTKEEYGNHLERHTIRPLPCAFAGCDEQFEKPIQAMQHEVQHEKEGHPQPLMRKPTYKPIVPSIPVRLGQPPHRLPSHRVIPRRVVKSTISADRHAVMGPWVLWNIFSPVELGIRKQNAPMRGRPSRQTDFNEDADIGRDYDFLLPISSYSTRTPRLDDLDSTRVTMDAARGLTVWGSGPDLNSSPRLAAAPGERTSGESAPLEAMAATSDPAKETTTGGGSLDNGVSVFAHQEQVADQPMGIGEEEDVERMLVV